MTWIVESGLRPIKNVNVRNLIHTAVLLDGKLCLLDQSLPVVQSLGMHLQRGRHLLLLGELKASKHYTLGNPKLRVASDHNPFLKILGDRRLEVIPNQRLLTLTLFSTGGGIFTPPEGFFDFR